MKRWADIIVTLWVLFVGVVYFGGAFFAAIGTRTWQLSVVYGIMLAISLVYAYLNRASLNSDEPSDPQ